MKSFEDFIQMETTQCPLIQKDALESAAATVQNLQKLSLKKTKGTWKIVPLNTWLVYKWCMMKYIKHYKLITREITPVSGLTSHGYSHEPVPKWAEHPSIV